MKEVNFLIEDSEAGQELKRSALTSHFSDRPLHAQIIENGYVLMSKGWHGGRCDGGVVDAHLHYISSTGYTSTGGCGYEFDPSGAVSKTCCIFIGSIHPVYGHAITDALRKLWFFFTDEGQRLISEGYELVYITTQDSKMPSWHLHIFELAGIDITKLVHLHHTARYDRIVVPDDSLFNHNGELYFTNEFRNVIDSIKSRIRQTSDFLAIPDGGSYYFTRTAFNHIMREVGEPTLERTFRRHGFDIVSPEKLSFEQQVAILMKCQRFASTEGSCSHSAIFCSPQSEVIVLRKADYANKYTPMIADFVGNKTIVIDAHHSIMTNPSLPMLGPFYLCVTSCLNKYFNIPSGGAFLGIRPSYWLYLASHHKIVNLFLRIYDKVVRRGLGWRRLPLG